MIRNIIIYFISPTCVTDLDLLPWPGPWSLFMLLTATGILLLLVRGVTVAES